jgi:hypothetical protein
MERAEVAGCMTATVPDRRDSASKGAMRQARLEVRYLEGILLKPTKRKPELRIEGWGAVRLNAIYGRSAVGADYVCSGSINSRKSNAIPEINPLKRCSLQCNCRNGRNPESLCNFQVHAIESRHS